MVLLLVELVEDLDFDMGDARTMGEHAAHHLSLYMGASGDGGDDAIVADLLHSQAIEFLV